MNKYIEVLTALLKESIIANFEYWSEFIIRIQRDEAVKGPALRAMFADHRIPSMFCLRLRGRWWVGDEREWETSVQQFPIKGTAKVPIEAPLQASSLMTMLDVRISDVEVNQACDLELILSDGRILTVQGMGGEWEESWLLELPVDDPERDRWSIVCDSQGFIGGSFPGIAK